MSTISKTTLSENDIRSILSTYLEGRISLVDLKEKLRNYIVIDFDRSKGIRKIQNISIPENIRVPVSSKHLRPMLQSYCNKSITFDELSNWAAFIFMVPFYVPEGETEEERWQSGNGVVWEIIQKLAEPNELDTLDISFVQAYLEQL